MEWVDAALYLLQSMFIGVFVTMLLVWRIDWNINSRPLSRGMHIFGIAICAFLGALGLGTSGQAIVVSLLGILATMSGYAVFWLLVVPLLRKIYP